MDVSTKIGKWFKRIVFFFLALFDYKLVRIETPLHIKAIMHHKIDVVLDIGAATGRYALELINNGYFGDIISFEPLTGSYYKLLDRTQEWLEWRCYNYGFGNVAGIDLMNVAGNMDSSSLLPMSNLHMEAAPYTEYQAQEEVVIKRLDSVFNDFVGTGQRAFVKLDVQGFEKQVLEGAEKSLDRIYGIQMEMSLQPTYDGSWDYLEALEFMRSKGFELWGIIPGFKWHDKGMLIQFDGVFFKN